MQIFRADIHIHTVLSPCGSLEMSPVNIVKKAKEKKLDILGITDHNSTRHCFVTREIAESAGIYLMMGVEITTREEIHCLAFFEKDDQLLEFQSYLDEHLPDIPNDPERFGHQVVVDAEENILMQESRLLISALDSGLEETESVVHRLNGLFIPAHIDKSRFSIISQLGFIPADIRADGFEVSQYATETLVQQMLVNHTGKSVLRNSDAHQLDQIGTCFTGFELEEISFNNIRQALLSPARIHANAR